jgi:hypothetical protein
VENLTTNILDISVRPIVLRVLAADNISPDIHRIRKQQNSIMTTAHLTAKLKGVIPK